MKVIVASFSKCGTKTLHKCLDILGYSVVDNDFHFFDHREAWKEILLKGSREGQFYEMYKDIDAVCDIPPSYYWDEIAAAFPDAKVILTTRNEEEWVRIFQNQMRMFDGSWLLGCCYLFTPTGRRLRENYRLLARVVFGCPPQWLNRTCHQPNEELLKKKFREHNAYVVSRCEKGRLLQFNFSDGWGPLCQFLKKDIPDIPFPHENKKGSLAISLWDLPNFAALKKEFFLVVTIVVAVFCFCLQLIFVLLQ